MFSKKEFDDLRKRTVSKFEFSEYLQDKFNIEGYQAFILIDDFNFDKELIEQYCIIIADIMTKFNVSFDEAYDEICETADNDFKKDYLVHNISDDYEDEDEDEDVNASQINPANIIEQNTVIAYPDSKKRVNISKKTLKDAFGYEVDTFKADLFTDDDAIIIYDADDYVEKEPDDFVDTKTWHTTSEGNLRFTIPNTFLVGPEVEVSKFRVGDINGIIVRL